jgi:hypothetical protein
MLRTAAAFTLAVALGSVTAAHAGPYADEFSKCLGAKMSDADRTTAAVWLFEEMSANPALKPMTNVTEAQRADARKAAAAMVQRVVTEDCRAQAAAALRNEGGGVLMRPFFEQGQASIGLLVRDPAVTAGMQQISQYLDVAKLAAIMRDPEPSKP